MAELTEVERLKYKVAFWHSVFISTVFRNILLGLEKEKFPALSKKVIENAIMVGMGAGSWMEDEFDPTGMDEEEIATRLEWRKDSIPWSIVKECCEDWDVDPDPICDAYWDDMEEGLAQNRAFLGIKD